VINQVYVLLTRKVSVCLRLWGHFRKFPTVTPMELLEEIYTFHRLGTSRVNRNDWFKQGLVRVVYRSGKVEELRVRF
jgi:hypothetical protein